MSTIKRRLTNLESRWTETARASWREECWRAGVDPDALFEAAVAEGVRILRENPDLTYEEFMTNAQFMERIGTAASAYLASVDQAANGKG